MVACSSNPLSPEDDALTAARAAWQAKAPAAYMYQFRRLCFCGPDVTRELVVEVIDGEVVSAVYVDDGLPSSPPLDEVPTIDDLFDEIQDAIDREAHQLNAEYDDELGYPVDVSIDYILEAVDEEMAFQVRAFEFLTLPAGG